MKKDERCYKKQSKRRRRSERKKKGAETTGVRSVISVRSKEWGRLKRWAK